MEREKLGGNNYVRMEEEAWVCEAGEGWRERKVVFEFGLITFGVLRHVFVVSLCNFVKLQGQSISLVFQIYP